MIPNEARDERPIFIVGARRSGTTLLRNMLNRHPAIAVCRETDFYQYVYRRRRGFGDLRDLANRRLLVKEYLATQRIQRLRLDSDSLASALLQEGVTCAAFFAALLRFNARTQGKPRWGEKTPGHALFTDTLCEWYPGASILHLVRDPRDVVASMLHMPSAPRNVIGNVRLWRHHNLRALRSRRHPYYLLVSYEQLVREPKKELSRICAVIGEEYTPAMLAPNWDPTADRPWFQRAEEPVTTQRVGTWREELTATQVALVEWIAGPLMQEFGYTAAGSAPTTTAIVQGMVYAAFDAARRRVGEFPGGWYSATRSTRLVKEEAAKERFRNRTLTRFVNR